MEKTGPQVAFLLSQVGAHTAHQFRKLLQNLDITTGHSGIIRLVSLSNKMSQKDLADRLSLLPSRLVVLIDELEEKGLMQRQNDQHDRRSHLLRLTEKGEQMMKSLSVLSRKVSEQVCGALTESEKNSLAATLTKIANHQGLTPNVHPGYKDRE